MNKIIWLMITLFSTIFVFAPAVYAAPLTNMVIGTPSYGYDQESCEYVSFWLNDLTPVDVYVTDYEEYYSIYAKVYSYADGEEGELVGEFTSSDGSLNIPLQDLPDNDDFPEYGYGYYIHYWAEDETGEEEEKCIFVVLDNTLEYTTLYIDGVQYNNFVSPISLFTFEIETLGSEWDTLYYKIDDNGFIPFENSGAQFEPFSIEEEGEHTIEYYYISINYGESNHVTETYMVDGTPPETTLTTTPEPVGEVDGRKWFNTNATFELSCTDDESGSGCNEIKYSLSPWQIYTEPFAVSEEGIYTLLYRSKDNVLNKEEETEYLFGIDKTPPNVSIEKPESDVTFITPGSLMEFKATGSENMCMPENGREWDFGDGATSYDNETTHAYSAVGTYIVRAKVRDCAFNTNEDTRTIIVLDNITPYTPLETSDISLLFKDTGGVPGFTLYVVKTDSAPQNPLPGFLFLGKYYTITSSLVDGTFQVTITFSYTDSEVAGIDENTLQVYYWDGTAWIAVPTIVDPVANTVTITIDHFTDFALFGSAPQAPSGGGGGGAPSASPARATTTAPPTTTAETVPTTPPTPAPEATPAPAPTPLVTPPGPAGPTGLAVLFTGRNAAMLGAVILVIFGFTYYYRDAIFRARKEK